MFPFPPTWFPISTILYLDDMFAVLFGYRPKMDLHNCFIVKNDYIIPVRDGES